jgi:hypothetical protein
MTTKIKTPHAAIIIWNYVDRIDATGSKADQDNKVEQQIVSTLSLSNLQTYKCKGDPVGKFHVALAPTRNWVSAIVPGSWCAIMMSNKPIDEAALKKADKDLIKMVGKIDSVRVDVTTDADGARQTRYLMSGEDWGHIFNNIIYIDPLISDVQDPNNSQGNVLFQQLMTAFNSVQGNTVRMFTVRTNMHLLMSLMGRGLSVPDAVRMPKAVYDFEMPSQMTQFFGFVNPTGLPNADTKITSFLNMQFGVLRSSEGVYSDAYTGNGWINPFSLAGTHTFWEVLLDNSNHALNEMYTEINWTGSGPQLTLYNRVKPFCYRDQPVSGSSESLRSKFQNIITHRLDDGLISSVNAGVAWKDKYNFIEIKPEMAEFQIYDNFYKTKSQAYERDNGGHRTFSREGFRPLLFSIKQIPLPSGKDANGDVGVDQFTSGLIAPWVNTMKEWYFDNHKLLNGRIQMTGSTEYIAVGNNVMFNADLIGLNHNLNSGATKRSGDMFVLAHVESVKNDFSVNSDGARQFTTTIEFVRGILVDANKNLIGEGGLDTDSTKLTVQDTRATANVVANSEDSFIVKPK